MPCDQSPDCGPEPWPNRIRGRAQRRTRVDDMAGEALKQSGLARLDAEMMQLHLRLRPGQRRRAIIGGGVAMLVDAGRATPRAIPPPSSRRRRERWRRAPRVTRRRSAKIGSSTAPTELDNGRASSIAIGALIAVPAAEEARPVGFEFRLADGFAIGDAEMRGPDFRLRRRPLAPRGEDRAEIGEIFGLDEQLREGGMRDIRALRPESQFGVGGDLDLARPTAGIGDA